MGIFPEEMNNYFGSVKVRQCPYCGMTSYELKEKGFLGCQHCYDVFAEEVGAVLSRVQKGSAHRGKKPGPPGAAAAPQDDRQRLESELCAAVAAEDYERAAVLRDEIRAMEAGR